MMTMSGSWRSVISMACLFSVSTSSNSSASSGYISNNRLRWRRSSISSFERRAVVK